MEFTHLHLHTAYSLLDGAIRLNELFPKLAEHGMDSVAVTDHGNMFGAVEFYEKAKAHGVKPIFGIETYVAGNDRFDKSQRRAHHLILLAKDQEGYQNLAYLSSKAYLEGFYYHPRIDKQLLRERGKGLIGLSACLGGEVAQTLMRQGRERAKETIREYQSLFDPGSFYLEVQPNGLPEQEQVNGEWRKLSRELDVPLVATGDCHYLNRGDSHAHNILMCIQQGVTVHDERKLHHKNDAYYVKAPSEFNDYFHDIPEAVENTIKIAKQCNVELDLGKTYLPRYEVPEGHDLDSYLRHVAQEGLERRFAELAAQGRRFDAEGYRERLAREMGVICSMGFAGYFLVVWDFIRFAKQRGIPVGPGRGSGAGSLVAYAMRITDLDPIPYNLLFERFLNPERVSMPDFDVDFCMNGRDDVIRYVTEKYGKERVGQIATFHQMKARLVIRDVARAMGLPPSEADKIAKLVPEPVQGKSPPLPQAIEEEPRLKELYAQDPRVRELLDVAKALENLNRHAGMHAAGVVIAEKPLWEHVPCFRGQNGEIVTQFAKDEVEKAGLVKFDFLGLKTLTVIHEAVKRIDLARGAAPHPAAAQTAAEPFDLAAIPMDDAGVYKMISAGDTTGVFQLESSGFKELLVKLKPDCFEDIVAAVALYRPGPLEGGMVDDFIKRKHGQTRVSYLHPALEPILKETYGVIVYQEQVMQIASALAGYSLGQADLLRRAMGKKKKEVMDKEKARFLEGCARKGGVDAKVADPIFDLMAFFAGYGFNKSHSAAYAVITYQTGYLKHHYPVEFMAGLLTCDLDNTDNIVKFIAEARAMGIEVRRPDVNESAMGFSVVAGEGGGKLIRFGLGAVKGVGEGAVEAILAARAAEGPFTSLYQLCERVDLHKVNRRVLEALVKSGACDGLARAAGCARAQLFGALESASERAQQSQRDRASGQTSLFGMLGGAPAAPAPGAAPADPYPDLDWSPKQLLAFEKEALGFYITGHPMDRFREDLQRYATCHLGELEARGAGVGEVSIGGVVCELREKAVRTGRMAWLNLEDPFGRIGVVVFPRAYEKLEAVLKGDEPLLCSGVIKDEGEEGTHVYKLHLNDAVPLTRVRQEKTSRVHLRLDAEALTPERLERLKGLLEQHRGGCAAVLHLYLPRRSETVVALPAAFQVAASEELLLGLERLFGERVAVLR